RCRVCRLRAVSRHPDGARFLLGPDVVPAVLVHPGSAALGAVSGRAGVLLAGKHAGSGASPDRSAAAAGAGRPSGCVAVDEHLGSAATEPPDGRANLSLAVEK